MFERVCVVGRGRVGSAIASRLLQRGLQLGQDGDLWILCVPDMAVAQVAGSISPGPWVAHVAGALPLSALDPHVNRFSLHPLQTFVRWRGAEQLDGAWCAVTAETDEAEARADWLAKILGLRAFPLADRERPLYHAAAVMTSNYLVTLYRAASRLILSTGAPPEALIPLLRRTVDNGFELTGPIARGDWETVERHISAIRDAVPELEVVYRTLADATVMLNAEQVD
jgi:predicted short-subunit dehydrogenase-like oxidoreductase (DUF2520 family)